jgi:tetratricopeptide (TPR) repeat protein
VNKGTMSLQWGKAMVDVIMSVPTMELAKENIKAAEKKGEKLEAVYSNAAEFYLDFADNNRKAMKYADKSLEVKETIGGLLVKALVYKADNKLKDAKKYLKKAINKAKSEGSEGWENYLTKKEASWEKE